MSRREVERLQRWIDEQRPPQQPQRLRDWVVDGLAMLYVGICGFIIIYFMFSL